MVVYVPYTSSASAAQSLIAEFEINTKIKTYLILSKLQHWLTFLINITHPFLLSLESRFLMALFVFKKNTSQHRGN